MARASFEERFWSKVRRAAPDECWPWLAGRYKRNGRLRYGCFQVESQRHEGAHRVAWRLTYGEIPAGLGVLHTCDNMACCNPGHLFLGTAADNNADMRAKGRARAANGERAPGARLTAEQVREIRSRVGETHRSLAREFGVWHQTIGDILAGRTWRQPA